MEQAIFEHINLKQFLCLCDRHHSIIQQFGSNLGCSFEAAVCIKGCFGQQINSSTSHKASKHDFVKAKKLYKTISDIRQNFYNLSHKVRKVEFPLFMKKIREQIDQFEQFMEKQLCNQIQVMQKYFTVNNMTFKLIQALVVPKLQDLQLSALKCKEVAIIPFLQQTINKQNKQISQEKGQEFYKKFFIKYLKSKQYISQKEQPKKQKIDLLPKIIEASYFKELPQRMFGLLKEFQSETNVQEVKKLIISIRQSIEPALQGSSQPSANSNKNLQTNVFFKGLQLYIQKAKPSILYLSVNMRVERFNFWQKFLTILNKSTKLKEVVVYTSKQVQNNYMAKFVKLYQTSLSFKVEPNVFWDNDNIQLKQQQILLNQDQKKGIEEIQKSLQLYQKTKKFK